jgi:hypothetical protein
VYRLRERLGYKHVEDLLSDQTGGELAGSIAYLRVDDEVQMQRLTIAIMKAFGSGQKQQPAQRSTNEEVIDTTDPEFTKHFKGFNYEKPNPQQRRRQQNTRILIG